MSEHGVRRRVYRPAWAEIDLGALAANVATMAAHVAPAELLAVVKADGYGHAAAVVAERALAAGATRLGVALVEEGLALREAGIVAPILILSEPSPQAMRDAIAAGITPTLYSIDGIISAHNAAMELGEVVGVHLKVDTGMHRVGADPQDTLQLASLINDGDDLRLEGIWTHLAVADRPSDSYTATQVMLFDATLAALERHGVTAPVHHLANSAAAISLSTTHRDWVRCGISLYGYLPSPELAGHLAAPLVPVLSLKAQVTYLRTLEAGERPSYGRIAPLSKDTDVAIVPLGYADGIPRNLGQVGGEVLIRGRRRPIVGNVTMDQIIVDCGSIGEVIVGDEVVLLGRQGTQRIDATEWARLVGTIPYEILCAIGPRVPRVVVETSPIDVADALR